MWEAALVNTQNPGARLLAVRFGQFSHLFIQTARNLGYIVDVIEVPWGDVPEKTPGVMSDGAKTLADIEKFSFGSCQVS